MESIHSEAIVADEDFDELGGVGIQMKLNNTNDSNHLVNDWKYYAFSRPMARDLVEIPKPKEEAKEYVSEEEQKSLEVKSESEEEIDPIDSKARRNDVDSEDLSIEESCISKNNLGVSYDGNLEREIQGEKEMEYLIVESSNNSVVFEQKHDGSNNPFHQ